MIKQYSEMNDEEKRKAEELAIASIKTWAASTIKACAANRDFLNDIINRPKALQVFTSDEIININQVRRETIPYLTRAIGKLEQLVCENNRLVTERLIWEKITELSDAVRVTGEFAALKNSKLEGVVDHIFGWIFCPYFRLNAAINNIQRKRRERRGDYNQKS